MGLQIVSVIPKPPRSPAKELKEHVDGETSSDEESDDEYDYKCLDKDCDFTYSGYGDFKIKVIKAACGNEFGDFLASKEDHLISALTGGKRMKVLPECDPVPAKELVDAGRKAMEGFLTFKNHSDCDGKYAHSECEDLYKALVALRPVFARKKSCKDWLQSYDQFMAVFEEACKHKEGYVIYT